MRSAVMSQLLENYSFYLKVYLSFKEPWADAIVQYKIVDGISSCGISNDRDKLRCRMPAEVCIQNIVYFMIEIMIPRR